MRSQGLLLEGVPWRTLVVLDACRFDLFQTQIKGTGIKGRLESVDSKAKDTFQWYRQYWSKPSLDTWLVTGHPAPFQRGHDKNFARAILTSWPGGWPSPLMALAEAVSFSSTLCSSTPSRLLVHLVPPHLPYIGTQGREFLSELGFSLAETRERGAPTVYQKVEHYGHTLGWARPRMCYLESLENTLATLEKFVDNLIHPVVITADHGEMIGENERYGHPYRHEVTYTVPWFEVS